MDTFSKINTELILAAQSTETIRRTLTREYDQIEARLGLLETLALDVTEKYIYVKARRTRECLEKRISQASNTNEFQHENHHLSILSFFRKEISECKLMMSF